MAYPTSNITTTKTTGQIIAAQHVNELQGAAEMTLRIVNNGSGATRSVGDAGYIDEAGDFQTTTTEHHDGINWAVVVVGGANGADIVVAIGGSGVTVTLDQNCSVGDFIYTSTSAGKATTETYVRPGIFGVATTANSSGDGGTAEFTLLCNRSDVALTSTNFLYNGNATHSGSDFVATINGAPSGTSVVYNAPSSGNEEFIDPAASNLARMLLHNSTRSNFARISSVDTGTNTITVSASGDISDWQSGDSITIRSTVNTGTVGSYYYADLEVVDATTIPALAVALLAGSTYRDTGSANQQFGTHAYESFDASKEFKVRTQVANVVTEQMRPDIPLINRRLTMVVQASGAGTVNVAALRLYGVRLAAP